MADLNIHVDDTLKQQAELVLSDLGISLSAATTMFLKQVVHCNGIPFEVRADSFYSTENLRRKFGFLCKEYGVDMPIIEDAVYEYNVWILEKDDRRWNAMQMEDWVTHWVIGWKEGISIGEERVRKAEALSIARKLVDMGYPTEEIVKITLLPEEEIKGLH